MQPVLNQGTYKYIYNKAPLVRPSAGRAQ